MKYEFASGDTENNSPDGFEGCRESGIRVGDWYDRITIYGREVPERGETSSEELRDYVLAALEAYKPPVTASEVFKMANDFVDSLTVMGDSLLGELDETQKQIFWEEVREQI